MNREQKIGSTAEPAYNRTQGKKEVCVLEEKSITRGVEL